MTNKNLFIGIDKKIIKGYYIHKKNGAAKTQRRIQMKLYIEDGVAKISVRGAGGAFAWRDQQGHVVENIGEAYQKAEAGFRSWSSKTRSRTIKAMERFIVENFYAI